MKFVKTEKLKTGMRLARPIYSKDGNLLFERDFNLSPQAIESMKSIGLLGIYILEPAEPLPPVSEEEHEFERFQAMNVSLLQEELTKILTTKKQGRMQSIVDAVLKSYGHQSGKMNFHQNLRSREDYIYRHSLNVAALCALITHVMNVRLEEQQQIIYAALVHDIGKLSLEGDLVYRNDLNEEEKMQVYSAQMYSCDIASEVFGAAVKRICNQALIAQMDAYREKPEHSDMKMALGAKILMVANRYDELTGMTLEGPANSRIRAVRELYQREDCYAPEVVKALVSSINVMNPGVSVELNTGEKALVLTENPENILRPTVLCFKDNTILDLSSKMYADFEIVDGMKTMDNRFEMDTGELRQRDN